MAPLHVRASLFFASIATSAAHDLIRTTWGVDRVNDPKEWLPWMNELAAKGYAGVEAATWAVCGVSGGPSHGCGAHACDEERIALWAEALESSGLYYISQLHTCGYPIESAQVEDHVASVKWLATLAKERLNATMANVHGGVDWWSVDEKVAFLRGAAGAEVEAGLLLSHETHRMRALSTPWTTKDVLDAVAGMEGGALLATAKEEQERSHATEAQFSSSFGLLNLTADLSHWVVAAERTMDFPSDAGWWAPLLHRVADASVLTHARVGSPREIQVADPAAPEVAAVLEAYEAWWNVIWARQIEKGAAKGSVVRVEAEFGPTPYMPVLPFTKQVVGDLDAAVEYIGRRQMKRLENGECQAAAA